MKVAAAGADEPLLRRQGAQVMDHVGRVPIIVRLQAVEPLRRQRGHMVDQRPWVRQHGQPAGVVDETNRLLRGGLVAGDIRRHPRPEIALERFTHRGDVPRLHQRPGDVRPAGGASPGQLLHALPRQRYPQHLEPRQHLPGALQPRCAIAREGGLESGVAMPDEVPQNVQLYLAGIGADLHAGDDGHTPPRAGLDGLVDPLHGVVIGERDETETPLVKPGARPPPARAAHLRRTVHC